MAWSLASSRHFVIAGIRRRDGRTPASESYSRFSQAERPGIFPPGSEAIGSDMPKAMPIADRLRPDENLLRQYVSI